MNKGIMSILVLLLLPCVSAELVISKVLSDPINTESGGEAVEIKNAGNSSASLAGVVLATTSSMSDAAFPGQVLLPGERFLIADEGWDEHKDDPQWRSADYTEKITLGNANAGVALIHNETVLDAIGWGEEEELLEQTPTTPAGPGKCLTRIADSNNNAEDVVEGDCAFFEGIVVMVETAIEQGFSAWVVNDASNDSGVQVRVGEDLVVRANGPGAVSIAGRNASLEQINESVYEARVETQGLSAGTYAVQVGELVLEVEVLAVSFVRVEQSNIRLDPTDVLVLENLGSVVTEVRISGQDLVFDDHAIKKHHMFIDGQSLHEERVIVLTPGEKKRLPVTLEKTNSPPGTYRSFLRITYDS